MPTPITPSPQVHLIVGAEEFLAERARLESAQKFTPAEE